MNTQAVATGNLVGSSKDDGLSHYGQQIRPPCLSLAPTGLDYSGTCFLFLISDNFCQAPGIACVATIVAYLDACLSLPIPAHAAKRFVPPISLQ